MAPSLLFHWTSGMKPERRRIVMAVQTMEKPVEKGTRAMRRFDPFEDLQAVLANLWEGWPLMRRPVRDLHGSRLAPVLASPRVDMFERGNKLVIKTDLPGVRRNEVQLTLEHDELVIHGERHEKEEVKEESYYRLERASGEFGRRIQLPFEVDAKDIQARFEDGVLEIELPLPSQARKVAEPIKIH
jgi:HSP20 family protein